VYPQRGDRVEVIGPVISMRLTRSILYELNSHPMTRSNPRLTSCGSGLKEDEKNEFGAEIIQQHLSERKKPN
jgi:hypothetical protein